MGCQASFLFSHRNNVDLEKVIELFKKYNIRTADDHYCSCTAKITLKKQITTKDSPAGAILQELGDCDFRLFKKDKQFLLIEGDRWYQSEIENLFNMENIEYTNSERLLIERLEIVFSDYMPCYKILENDKYALVEVLDICTHLPDEKYMSVAKGIAEELNIKGKNVEEAKKTY